MIGTNCAVIPTNSAKGSQYGTPITRKKIAWNVADSAGSATFETT